MRRFWLEIDYETVYDIEKVENNICSYFTTEGDVFEVSLDAPVIYREYTPFLVENLVDLKKLLGRKDVVLIYNEDGWLIDYPDETIWDPTLPMLDWDSNILIYLDKDLIGTFSKEKTTTLGKFLEISGYYET